MNFIIFISLLEIVLDKNQKIQLIFFIKLERLQSLIKVLN